MDGDCTVSVQSQNEAQQLTLIVDGTNKIQHKRVLHTIYNGKRGEKRRNTESGSDGGVRVKQPLDLLIFRG